MTTSRHAGKSGEKGQAIVELLAVVVIFAFVGLAVLETGMLYHNMNVLSNGLKEATWAASYGAHNDKISMIMNDAAEDIVLGAFMMHRSDTFQVSVWQPGNDTGTVETAIDPLSPTEPVKFTGHMLVNGRASRAANLYRAEGYSIRLGVTYTVSFFVPLFGSAPLFSARIPLTVSEPIHATNDEDRDGLVDLYEPELLLGAAGLLSYAPLSHLDNGASDTPLASDLDIDGDGRLDIDEDTPVAYGQGISGDRATISNWQYDFDNDNENSTLVSREDKYEKASTSTDTQSRLRHPVIGGPPGTRYVVP